MASNSYYGDNQHNGQNSAVPYGQSPYESGQQGYGGQNQNYDHQQQQNYGGYGAQNQQQGGATFAEQAYPDGSREQKYDAQGNPVLPNGERGLLGDLAGAAGGAFLGHKAGGHSFLGAIAGGIGAHLLGDTMGSSNGRPSYGRPQQGGMLGGMFGRRDIDGTADGSQENFNGQSQGYGQVDYQQQGQYNQGPYGGNHQQGGQYGGGPGGDNQAYGQNYGQGYGQ